ncbi:MAG: c-type cytochrome [Candidatus Binatia bacterium]
MKVRTGPATLPLLLCVVAMLGPLRSVSWAESAAKNYEQLCRKCHGEDGSGNGPAAGVLDKHPGDFTDCAAMQERSRDFVVKIIAGGGAAVGRSVQMPVTGKKLSPEEVEALADYVMHHFCGGD